MIQIRRTEDLDLVAELDAVIFPRAPRLTAEELEKTTWWVASGLGRDVGYGGIWLGPANNRAFLTRSGVSDIARGQGLQKRFIRTRVMFARRNGIERVYTYTATYNIASMRSLLACGFKPYHREYTAEGEFIYFENRPKA